jgi:hypothetical protein
MFWNESYCWVGLFLAMYRFRKIHASRFSPSNFLLCMRTNFLYSWRLSTVALISSDLATAER